MFRKRLRRFNKCLSTSLVGGKVAEMVDKSAFKLYSPLNKLESSQGNKYTILEGRRYG